MLSVRCIGDEKMCVMYGMWDFNISEKARHWERPFEEMSGSGMVRSSTAPVLCAGLLKQSVSHRKSTIGDFRMERSRGGKGNGRLPVYGA